MGPAYCILGKLAKPTNGRILTKVRSTKPLSGCQVEKMDYKMESCLTFGSPGNLSNSRIEPWSLALQADSLPAEPQGKPKNTAVGSLPLPQWTFPSQELDRGLLNCRQILCQLSYQGSPNGQERTVLVWI